MKDIRRLCSLRFFRARRRFFAISKPAERGSIGIDISGWLGNSGEVKVVQESRGSMVGRSEEMHAFKLSYLRLIDVA